MDELIQEVATHAEYTFAKEEIIAVFREESSAYDRDVPNSDIIKMSVRAFGWEVNRNGFMHKKKVLKRSVEDAFKEKLPLYRTFEGKLVDRNHLMKDSGSRQDNAIGYISAAYMKEDGVYFDMTVWKRCITDEEQRQIRDGEVSVSMEVDFTKPVVLIDGQELPSTPENLARKGAVRSYADDANINGLGIAVLFDGITPGYASASVVETENAVLDVTQPTTEDTVPTNKERDIEAASVDSIPSEENQMELDTLKAELEKRDAELAAANDALAAKSAEIDKLFDELQALRQKAFNDTVAAAFDLGKLEPLTAGWLLDMLRWSTYDLEETCAKLVEIAGAIKAPASKPAETATEEPAAPSAEVTETPTEEPAAEPVVEEPAAEPTTENAEEAPAATEEEPTTEIATAPVNIAAGEPTQFGNESPKWGIEHL